MIWFRTEQKGPVHAGFPNTARPDELVRECDRTDSRRVTSVTIVQKPNAAEVCKALACHSQYRRKF